MLTNKLGPTYKVNQKSFFYDEIKLSYPFLDMLTVYLLTRMKITLWEM